MELNYDDMLNKMNLKYLNGSFYKAELPVPEPPKLGKKDIIKIIRMKQIERAENIRQQIQKRKLVIPSANTLKINSAPNNFFKLR